MIRIGRVDLCIFRVWGCEGWARGRDFLGGLSSSLGLISFGNISMLGLGASRIFSIPLVSRTGRKASCEEELYLNEILHLMPIY